MKVTYEKTDGSIGIDIDSSELLKGRADMSDEPGEQKLQTEGLGGDNRKIESKLEKDKMRLGWTEPTLGGLEVYHICPVCGTNFKGRTNRIYCSPRCSKTAEVRRRRKRMRDIRNFKPHRGTAGEVYFMYDNNGKDGITFVPAFNADTRARAKKYIEDTYPDDKREDYFEQVKEVILK